MENDTQTQTLDALDVLRQTGNGQTAYEFDNALKEAARALRGSGGRATVTVTLKLEAKSGETQVQLSGTVKKTLPTVSGPLKVLYTTPEGGLCVNDPAQAAFKFQSLGSSTPEGYGGRNG